uniref:Uncharacterized protein n=1 Tax=Solibacter usitatus (strain Ellin6076) TaxID=234267 RepID=Q01P70_SOLUE
MGNVKYKRLPATTYQNSDLYQLLACVVALDLPGGTLVYAADKGVSAAVHAVVQNRKRLEMVALDLSAPRPKLRQQISEIAERIRHWRHLRNSYRYCRISPRDDHSTIFERGAKGESYEQSQARFAMPTPSALAVTIPATWQEAIHQPLRYFPREP